MRQAGCGCPTGQERRGRNTAHTPLKGVSNRNVPQAAHRMGIIQSVRLPTLILQFLFVKPKIKTACDSDSSEMLKRPGGLAGGAELVLWQDWGAPPFR